MVYSIYLRGAGGYGRGWVKDIAQSRLIQVSEETGGFAYFEEFSDPITITPFLKNLQDQFENQYLVTFDSAAKPGFQAIRFRTELPGVKISSPKQIFVR
jgi:hypothetical protein